MQKSLSRKPSTVR